MLGFVKSPQHIVPRSRISSTWTFYKNFVFVKKCLGLNFLQILLKIAYLDIPTLDIPPTKKLARQARQIDDTTHNPPF